MFPLFKKKYILSFLACGLILFVCYLIAGIFGECFGLGVPAGTAVLSVITTPFSNHFNDFTPLLLIIGFVAFEFLWFLRYLKPELFERNKDKPSSGEAAPVKEVGKPLEPEPNYGAEPDIPSDSVPESPEHSSKDIDITEFGFVIPDDVVEMPSKDTDKEEKDIGLDTEPAAEEDDLSGEVLSFSSDVFWDLSGDYSPEQIREMVKLKKYMKNLDGDILRRTFKPTLSPDEIREYIELFYE